MKLLNFVMGVSRLCKAFSGRKHVKRVSIRNNIVINSYMRACLKALSKECQFVIVKVVTALSLVKQIIVKSVRTLLKKLDIAIRQLQPTLSLPCKAIWRYDDKEVLNLSFACQGECCQALVNHVNKT